MSYDISLMADTGGEPFEIWSRNHTSNTRSIWVTAGCDIAEFDGSEAWELVHDAYRAIVGIQGDVPKYRAMEPGNGWGTVESTLSFLQDIHHACTRHPKTTVRISR